MAMQNETAAAAPREFLTFTLGHEEYGIDILRVQEIRGYDAVTSIANTPSFIKGVINLRGIIVPIVDLRVKFNLQQITYDAFTVVIILNIATRTVGIVVDGVSDVVALDEAQIKPPPDFSTRLDSCYIKGLGTLNNRMLILIDIEQLMSSNELQLVAPNLTAEPALADL